MKNWTAVLLALLLGTALVASAAPKQVVYGTVETRSPADGPYQHTRSNLDEILYYEDWEDGVLGDWVPEDLTAVGSTWHLDDYVSFEGVGTSWWVGDPDVGANGGYDNQWYMTLNSPQVELGDAPMLSFFHRWAVEDTAGVSTDAPGYTGWDASNIRVSTDGGATWTVITNVTPAYSSTSCYSFGDEHGEGFGVPGWTGSTEGVDWHLQTANLSAWANQTVILRWAFASDPGFSTPNDPDLFGWMVDNIRVYSGTDTVLSHNADAEEGFSSSTQVPVGGNLWRIATDNTSPDGPHIVVCNNAGTNLYNSNMNSVLTGPTLDISDLSNGLLIADFQVTGAISPEDCGTTLDCDYWGIQVSFNDGETWCRVSNPDCSAPQYVYIDAPAAWQAFNDSYSTPMDFSQYLLQPDPPQSLKFRFTIESNADSVEYGPKLDGFVLNFESGFPNDLSCYTLQVKYPTMMNRPISMTAYFENIGGQPQAQVPAWYRVTGLTQQRFLPNLQLDPGGTDTRSAMLTLETAGFYEVKAWPALTTDQDQSNDTSRVPPFIGTLPEDGEVYQIYVQNGDEDLELGYDNRHVVYRYNYATGNGPMCHFTPEADDIAEVYDLNAVLGSFTAVQTGNQPIRVHVYAGDETAPGEEIYNEEITVASDETGTNEWKVIDLSEVEATRQMSGDFWVWFEVVTTGTDRYPQILGNDAEEWEETHFYTWTGTGAPTAVDLQFQIHARVVENTAIGDRDEVEIPASWSLAQNYPNPFNPTTEIQYSVPSAEHMTLKVFNLIGQEVRTLVDGVADAGIHTVSFDGAGLSSGVYVYRLDAQSFTQSRKMLLMK